ncbi:MAG: carboxypeptidase regulatory-like domain-containing protein, partial [Acidobacteria bacterium]|nr:carboxypeptidase regulatory-like domain-containing protein [Acidobacteriota bacterium]
MPEKFKKICLSLLYVLFFCCTLAYGQIAAARLEGIVKDTSGAVVPGASITATNEGT